MTSGTGRLIQLLELRRTTLLDIDAAGRLLISTTKADPPSCTRCRRTGTGGS